MPVPDQFGTLLREFRVRAGLTQAELARRSTIGIRTIRRLENGELLNPQRTTVKLLADELMPEQRRALYVALDGSDQAAAEPSAAGPGPSPVPEPLREAAEELAREIAQRWRSTEELGRLHDPCPLPVRWRTAPAGLTDRPENVQQLAPGAQPQAVELSGKLSEVAEVYGRIPSGRLLVLGRAGAGKSVLAIRFAREHLKAAPVPGRVPVVFSIGSWDPTAATLRDWLVRRLLRDHPYLGRRTVGGATLAAALVDADLVLPVLDGFDEIAEGLRHRALEQLNETSTPLVLTSRCEEFEAAVQAACSPLVLAAGIELADLTVPDLAAYLPRTVRTAGSQVGPRWAPVLDALSPGRIAEHANLAEVLTTPLMVGLARTMYSDDPGQDPAELLDAERFATVRSLEEHLLAGFLPAVYRPRPPQPGRRTWEAARARHWLGHLAHHLADQQDLAWWRLGASLRYPSRLLAVVLATTVCVSVAQWLLSPLIAGVGLGQILLMGALLGPVAGLAFGSLYAVTAAYRRTAVFEPSRMQLRWGLPGARGAGVHRPARAVARRFGHGLIGGSVQGLGYSCVLTVESLLRYGPPHSIAAVLAATLVNTLVFGLIFGLAAGLALALMAALEVPVDVTSVATPMSLLTANRATVCRQVLVLVPVFTLAIAFGGRLVVLLLNGWLGPLSWGLWDGLFIGAVGGLGGAVSYALAFTAWGQWVLLTRLLLPLTGRLPWDTAAFLDDAYHRGVLRRSGAVYQFRHLWLQHHLADRFAGQPATDRTAPGA
ncbi:helix-turn-helix domain-containing protein [Kitasatospora sp. NPDC002227]|uniref:helix-turn-helix domain-containing protein n=1 Tax=Kitasatospora sp. NPDC002227 TaxID=3154773 RepID=UPI0033225D6A